MIRDDMIYGKNPVMEAIRAGREINKIFIAKDIRDNIFNEAREKGIIVINTDRRKLDKIAGNNDHQGIVAYVSPYGYSEVEDILSEAEDKKEDPLILLLDELTDDNNLANIIRSANAFGVHGIIIPKRNSASVNSIVAKRSAGAIEHMKIARVTNLVRIMEDLKQKGFWIYCGDIDSENEIQDISFEGPVALIIGSEGYGAGKLVKEKSDFLVKIPQKGEIGSLNAANAAAVIIYEIFRQKKQREKI